ARAGRRAPAERDGRWRRAERGGGSAAGAVGAAAEGPPRRTGAGRGTAGRERAGHQLPEDAYAPEDAGRGWCEPAALRCRGRSAADRRQVPPPRLMELPVGYREFDV